MTQNTEFGKSVKKKLIDIGQTNTWLCNEVAARMGRYFDDSVLSRICRGQSSKTLNEAKSVICEILEIKDESEVKG
mgnify:CR=1 FL=1